MTGLAAPHCRPSCDPRLRLSHYRLRHNQRYIFAASPRPLAEAQIFCCGGGGGGGNNHPKFPQSFVYENSLGTNTQKILMGSSFSRSLSLKLFTPVRDILLLPSSPPPTRLVGPSRTGPSRGTRGRTFCCALGPEGSSL